MFACVWFEVRRVSKSGVMDVGKSEILGALLGVRAGVAKNAVRKQGREASKQTTSRLIRMHMGRSTKEKWETDAYIVAILKVIQTDHIYVRYLPTYLIINHPFRSL